MLISCPCLRCRNLVSHIYKPDSVPPFPASLSLLQLPISRGCLPCAPQEYLLSLMTRTLLHQRPSLPRGSIVSCSRMAPVKFGQKMLREYSFKVCPLHFPSQPPNPRARSSRVLGIPLGNLLSRQKSLEEPILGRVLTTLWSRPFQEAGRKSYTGPPQYVEG
jgi:hypothetical protein